MLVQTTKGLIDHTKLEVKDYSSWDDNGYRILATEWRLNGELVRRDVNANLLVNSPAETAQGKLG